MKIWIPALCVALLAHAATFAQVNAWEQKADFPGDGRSAAVSFSFMDKGFIGTGYDGEDFRRSFYMYDPVLDTWTQTESLGGAAGEGMERNCAAAFTIGNKGYIGTGQSGDPFLNDFWEYDKMTNVWTIKGSVGGIDRRCGVGFSVSGKGYIGLGQDAVGYRNDLWAFDTTTGAWTQKADFIGTPRRLSASFVIGGLAYVGTGDDGAFTNDFYVYDPTVNTWNARADFAGSPRYGATGFALNGKGYIACGYDTTFVNRADFYEYDPIADTWTPMPDFPGGPRANATAFVIDTLAYFGMGYDTAFNYDIWLWGDTTNPKPIDTSITVVDIEADAFNMIISPNPVQTTADITILGSAQDIIDVQIFDMAGRNVTALCEVSAVLQNALAASCGFTTSSLPAGTFHCMVRSKDHTEVVKFVVIK